MPRGTFVFLTTVFHYFHDTSCMISTSPAQPVTLILLLSYTLKKFECKPY